MTISNPTYKSTDKEGRIRLGEKFASKQWQITELEDGIVVLIPLKPASNSTQIMKAFEKAFKKHIKTIDALK